MDLIKLYYFITFNRQQATNLNVIGLSYEFQKNKCVDFVLQKIYNGYAEKKFYKKAKARFIHLFFHQYFFY